MAMFLYAVPERILFKKWSEAPSKNRELRKHVLIRNPTATAQKLFVAFNSTDQFRLLESTEHSLKIRTDSTGRPGYEYNLMPDGTLPLVVIFKMPASREEMSINFQDSITVFSMFTTLSIPIRAVALADSAMDSAFFPQDLDIPRGPLAEFFFPSTETPRGAPLSSDFKLVMPELPSVLGALSEVARIKRQDDEWRPMASLAPHEAAIEQLIHDDIEEDFGVMDGMDEMHEISFSGSETSSPSQSPRKPVVFSSVPKAPPPMRALAVGSLAAQGSKNSAESNSIDPQDNAELHVPSRGASASGTLRSALGLGPSLVVTTSAPTALAPGTSATLAALARGSVLTAPKRNSIQSSCLDEQFGHAHASDFRCAPQNLTGSAAAKNGRSRQTSFDEGMSGSSFGGGGGGVGGGGVGGGSGECVMELNGMRYDAYGRVLSPPTANEHVHMPGAANGSNSSSTVSSQHPRPSRRASGSITNSAGSAPPALTMAHSSVSAHAIASTIAPSTLRVSASSYSASNASASGSTARQVAPPAGAHSISQAQRLAATLARAQHSHTEQNSNSIKPALPDHLLSMLDNHCGSGTGSSLSSRQASIYEQRTTSASSASASASASHRAFAQSSLPQSASGGSMRVGGPPSAALTTAFYKRSDEDDDDDDDDTLQRREGTLMRGASLGRRSSATIELKVSANCDLNQTSFGRRASQQQTGKTATARHDARQAAWDAL